MLSPRLDRALFTISLQLIALRIPARKCNAFMQRLSDHVIHRPKIKPIQPDGEQSPGTTRLLLLAESVTDVALTGLPSELKEFVQQEGAEAVPHHLELGYDAFTADQVLRRILPEGMEVPSAFEQIGHIAHMNLRDELLPYKRLIGEVRSRKFFYLWRLACVVAGAVRADMLWNANREDSINSTRFAQVILDKNPRLRTVVNKVESISNEFRVFPMEVIAGEDSFCTSTRENGCIFHMDYREVYWNSRLEREHRRIIELLQEGDVICDMFCGIGPFAIPAAARGHLVYANDLNPASVHWLRRNVQANKVGRRVRLSNMCGREFLRGLTGMPGAAAAAVTSSVNSSSDPVIEPPALVFGEFQHVLMNLPASGIEFLDSFVGAFDRRSWQGALPRVHCYCFSKAADARADVIARAEEMLGCKLPDAEAHIVRDVAPSKLMLCVSFVLPSAIAWKDVDEGSVVKRMRTNDAAHPPPL